MSTTRKELVRLLDGEGWPSAAEEVRGAADDVAAAQLLADLKATGYFADQRYDDDLAAYVREAIDHFIEAHV